MTVNDCERTPKQSSLDLLYLLLRELLVEGLCYFGVFDETLWLWNECYIPVLHGEREKRSRLLYFFVHETKDNLDRCGDLIARPGKLPLDRTLIASSSPLPPGCMAAIARNGGRPVLVLLPLVSFYVVPVLSLPQPPSVFVGMRSMAFSVPPNARLTSRLLSPLS